VADRPWPGSRCYHRAPMSDGSRYYLTTAIAYANNKPGLHTLYEVVGADVIARWHRMKGDDTRFLTGTDEHSINIAQSAVDEGRSAREFVDEKVAYFRTAEDALAIAPDRFIRTTDPDHIRAAQEMVRRAHANGDIYLGTYEGWYCPNEGFRNPTDVQETARGTICPNHPEVPLQWLTERNWFFRLSAYQERLERHFAEHPDFVQPDYRRNEMLGFIRGGLEDFSISRERTPGGWGIPFPISEDGASALLEDGTWDPEAGVIYVWYDALINYITGAGFPDDPEAFARWWPADLHVIGKDIARFHTIFWPAMLWSAGLDAPRHVWVHGWLLAAGGERMSKSRGNFLDPNDFVTAFGQDGARYVVLREVPFDRDAEVSWDSFVRRYNADLANDFGNLLNRTVSMTNRYLGGERPAPRAGGDSPLGEGWSDTLRLYQDRLEGCLLHDALAELWEFVGGANKVVDAEQPWALAKAWKAGDEAAGERLRGVLGDLLEACRLVGLAVAPYMPSVTPRVHAQLGFAYGYGSDGNGGPAILEDLAWGARAAEPGRVSAPEPLFPRLDVEESGKDDGPGKP
jgi:methionyl-tRNA synthetase